VGGPAAWAMHCAPESCPAPSRIVPIISGTLRPSLTEVARALRICSRVAPSGIQRSRIE
jgi:hypothetical protein